MAYTGNTLSQLQGAIGGRSRWWTYETADSLATVLGAGYVSDATKRRLIVGDIIFCRFGTLNTTGPDAATSTNARGVVSEFAAAPGFEVLEVDAIASGAATLKTARAESITDNSGGNASATAGIAAGAATQFLSQTFNLADLLGTDEHKIDPGFNGKLLAINARVQRAATTAAKAATLTARVNALSMTGGVVALTSANCTPAGSQVAGSAITAGVQTFTNAQTIGFLLSSVTTFVEGSVAIEYKVFNQDLADAIATLIKF